VIAGVLPVVGQLVPIVIAHDLDAAAAVGSVDVAAAAAAALRNADETVHLAAVDRGFGSLRAMRPAFVAVVGVVEGPHALARRVGNANGRHAVAHRYPVGTGKRAEVS